MSDGCLQNALLRAVVDGQYHVDLLDVDIAHDAAAVKVQLVVVGGLFFVGHVPVDPVLSKAGVVIPRPVEDLTVLVGIHIRHMLRICHHSPGLVEGVPIIRKRRICQKTDADHHNAHKSDREQAVCGPTGGAVSPAGGAESPAGGTGSLGFCRR